MDFGVNKTPVGEITEGALGGTYFRSIYPSFNEKWYIKSWKEFDQLKNIDQKFYCSDYYNVSVNKDGVKCGTSLAFWENKSRINEIDPNSCFQLYFRYWLGRRYSYDERQINRRKRIISRIQSRLKLDKFYCSGGYQLTENDFY